MSSRDKRIVEMQFDNAAFERGAAKSMGTLQKLKDSLDFTKPVKSLANSFGIIKSEVDGLNNQFTTAADTFKNVFLGTLAGQTAYKGVVAGFNFIKKGYDATIGQIISGGKRRAQNIEQAKFQLGGLGVDWDAIYEDLDYAVAGTAYGLDEAARVGSQFVASGVSLGKDMKEALRGISGVAAMTNSSYDEIGNIFTTVAGQGKLMTMQLNQLAGRGLNVAGTLADAFGTTEAAVRDMVTKGQVDFHTFAKAMDEAYGEHATKANDTFSGSLSNLRAALSRIGALFATPAYDNLRTVINATTPVINAFKKAITPVADEVAKLMEVLANLAASILNNFDTSVFTKIMTPVSAFVSMITDSISTVSDSITNSKMEKAVETLKKYTEAEKQAARDIWIWGTYGDGEVRKKKLKEAGLEYKNVQDYLEEYVMTFKEAEYEEAIAADNAEELAKTTTQAGKILRNAKWYSVFRNMGFNDDTTKSIVNIIETVRNLGIVVKNVATSVGNVVTAAISGVLGYSGYRDLTGNVEDISLKMAALSEKLVITKDKAKPVTAVFYKITEAVVKTATAIAKLINGIKIAKRDFEGVVELGDASNVQTEGGLGGIIKILGSIVNGFKEVGKWASRFGKDISKLDSVKRLGEAVKPIAEWFAKLFDSFRNRNGDIQIATAEIGDMTGTVDALTVVLTKLVDLTVNSLASVLEKIPGWVEGVKGFIETIFDGTYFEGKTIGDIVIEMFSNLKGFFSKDKTTSKKKATDWGENVFSGLIDGAKNALAKFNWKELEKVSLFAGILVTIYQLNKAVKTVTGTLQSIKDIPKAIVSTFSTVGDFFKALQKLSSASAISMVALSISALVMSLTFLADVPVDALARAVVYVVLIMEALKSLVSATAKLGNITKNVNKSQMEIGSNNTVNAKVFDPIMGVGVMLFGLATAIGVIYFAIRGFNKMDPEHVNRSISQVAIIIGAIVGSIVVLLAAMKKLKVEKIPWSMIAAIGAIAASVAGIMLSVAGAGLMMSVMSEQKMAMLENIFGAVMACLAGIIGAIAAVGHTKMSSEQILSMAAVMASVGFAMIEIGAAMALVMATVHDNEFSVSAINAISTTLVSLFALMAGVMTLGGFAIEKAEWVTPDEMVTLAQALDVVALSIVEIAASIALIATAMGHYGLKVDDMLGLGGVITGMYMFMTLLFGGLATYLNSMRDFEGFDADSMTKLAAAIDVATAGVVIIAAALAIMALAIPDPGKLAGVSIAAALMLAAVAGILVGFGYLAKKNEFDGDELIKMAASIAIMAGVLAALALAIALIGKISINWGSSIGIMLIALGSIAALAFIGTRMGDGIEKIAKSLIMFAAAGLIFAASIWVFAKATDALGDALPKFADGLSAFCDKLGEHKAAIAVIVGAIIGMVAALALAIVAAVRFGPAIESAFQVFINIATMIGNALSEMEDEGKQKIMAVVLAVAAGLAAATPGLLKAFGEILIKVMTFLGILIGPLANALLIFVVEVINGVAEAVKSNSGPLLAAIINLLTAVMTLVSYAVKELLMPVVNMFNYLVTDFLLFNEGALWYVMYTLLEPFRMFGSEIIKIIAKCRRALVWLTEDDFIWGNILGTYHKGDQARANIDKWLDDSLKSFNDKMIGINRGVLNRSITDYVAVKDDLDNIDKILSGEMKSDMLENYLAGFDDFNTKLDKIGKDAVAANNVSSSIKTAYTQLAEDIKVAEASLQEAETASDKASNAEMIARLKNRSEMLKEQLDEAGEEDGESAGAAFVNSFLGSLSTSDSIKGAVTDKLTEQIQGAIDLSGKNIDAAPLWEGIQNGSIDASSANQIADALGIDEQSAAGIVDIFNGLGADGIIALAEGEESASGEAEEATDEVVDYSIQALEGAKSDARKAGFHFTGGFAAGIWDNRDIALQNAWMVADRAANELARRLKERSPSRVTAEMGKFFSIGFANGISNYAGVAVDRTTSMAEETTNAFRASLQTISDAISSDVEANPTIRPVMDLSNVRSSVGSINSMFSAQSARYAAINSRLSHENSAYQFELDQSSKYDNTDVVSSIGSLQDEMSGLKDAMMDTQIVMDSGVLVGQLAPGMDRTLGRMSARKARRN